MVTRLPASGPGGSDEDAPVPAHVLVIVAPYYAEIAEALLAGARAELSAREATCEVVTVAGALEIPQALVAAVDAEIVPRSAEDGRFDGVIAIGCVVRGETAHYDVVVENANHWLMEVAIDEGIPLGNAILTVDTIEQARARAEGGRSGKGGDAARACLGLIALRRELGADDQ